MGGVPWQVGSDGAIVLAMSAKANPSVQQLVEEAAELSPGDRLALIEAIQSLPRREETAPDRHTIVAARVARVHAGVAATLSMEEVEQSLRDDLDF